MRTAFLYAGELQATQLERSAAWSLRVLGKAQTAVLLPEKRRSPLEGSDRPDPAGKVLVVVVLPAAIGKVDVMGHVRARLRRGPIGVVVRDSGVAKIGQAARLQIAIDQRQFVARRKEPAAHSVQTEISAQICCCTSFKAGFQHLLSVLFAAAHSGRTRAVDGLAEATPFGAAALVEWCGFKIAPAIRSEVRVLVEDHAAGGTDVAGFILSRREPDAHLTCATVGP